MCQSPEKRYKLACVPIEDSDKTALLRRLIRALDGHSMESQWLNMISDGQLSPTIRTDLNLRLTHLPACSLCWAPASTCLTVEPVHEISNNVVCATSKASGQPVHMRSLIRAFVCRLSIL